MKILVTGAAGFIGFHVARALLERGHTIVGLDNINDYYDPELKYARLAELGIRKQEAEQFKVPSVSDIYGASMRFVRMNLEDREAVPLLFKQENFEAVCHLAAQAGVRYSLENPEVYVDSNIVGFLNILEGCRHQKIGHLVYASSSSVYGLNKKVPFSVEDNVDHPISLYAATKKSNELMAHTYSHLYGFPTTGLRFFTVYGPWGRPDMALFLFTEAIVNNRPIKVFNKGEMERDFTYIDDITKGVLKVLEAGTNTPLARGERYKLYNIGNNHPVKLLDFITELERNLGKKAIKKFLPMQAGDVKSTWANVDNLMRDYHYEPKTDLKDGMREFVKWFRDYYNSREYSIN